MRPAEFALQLLESEQFTEFSRRGVIFSLFWLAKKAQVVGASTSHWLWGSHNVKTCPGWRLIGLQIPMGLLKSWIWYKKQSIWVFLWIILDPHIYRKWRSEGFVDVGVGDETRRAHVLQLTAMWLDKDMDINWVVLSDVSACFRHISLGFSHPIDQHVLGKGDETTNQSAWTLCMFAMSWNLVCCSAMCNRTANLCIACHRLAQAT